MIHQGSLVPEVRPGAIAALKAMVEYGKSRKVSITIENRDTGGAGRGRGAAAGANPAGGATAAAGAAPAGRGGAAPAGQASWETTVEVTKAAGAYANPDTCNFPNKDAHDAGLRVMYAMTAGSSHLHYTPNWDEADGIRIAKEVGYKGLFSIEVANAPDPYEGVRRTREILLQNL
jgi:sugar phosphate isomerase/epimerase